MNKTAALAKKIAFVGMMTASIECVKLALASIPNVEAVTLLIGVFSYSFGVLGLISTLLFVIIESLIWGFGTWIISYLIYWPLLSVVFIVLGKIGRTGILIPTAAAVLMTALFGVISSLVDVGIFSGSYDNFFYRFGIYYARGIVFYITQIVTNLVLFPTLFVPLTRVLKRFSIK